MFKAISDFFEQHLLLPEQAPADADPHALRLATAALLIEMTRADYDVKAVELERILVVLQEHFGITKAETHELIELAESEADHATTYHEFTSLINRQYSQEQKIQVIELLWEVAAADDEIEKYEDHLVRKISELLYVSHKDFIAAKHRVLDKS